ncbi:MAG: amino acid permease [Synergistetes bacterium]|nr:amino acid permease [Synergistota bacterium]
MSKGRLRSELGLLDTTSIVAGIVIGAGLFIVTGIAAKFSGSLVWLAYLIGAVPIILIGLTTASLSSFYPVEGGSYVYPSRIIHPLFGFLTGWSMWLAIIGPIAITAKAFINYLNALPGVSFNMSVIAGAVVLTLAFLVINYLGIKLVAVVQNILFIFLVLGILIFTFLGLPHMKLAYLRMGSPMGFSGVLKAASLLIFAYAGITVATDIGEEVRDPSILPKAVLLGVLIPIVLYVSSSLVCVGVLPWGKFAASKAPYATAASTFMGSFGVAFIVLVAWAAILTSHNGEQATAARVAFSLSRDKLLPGFYKINKYGIPHVALIVGDIIAIFLIITGTIQLVAEIVVASFLLEWIAFHLCVFFLPKRFPEMYEKGNFFKLDGWKIIFPVLGLGISVYFLILQGPKALAYFGIWLLIGTIVYFVGFSKNKEEVKKLVSEWPRGRYLE